MPEPSFTGNLVDHLRKSAEKIPSLTAVISANDEFDKKDFQTLYFDVKKVASFFNNKGVKKSDRSLLLVKPGYDLIVCCFALLFIGAIPIIIDPGMGLRVMMKCIAQAKPKSLIGISPAIMCSYFFRKTFESLSTRVTVFKNFPQSSKLQSTSVDSTFDFSSTREDDLAAVVFTSGSTGRPKGVRYLHKNFNSQIKTLKTEFCLKEGEIDLVTLPIFSLFNPALGVTSVIPAMDPRKPALADPGTLVKTIINHNVTTAFCSPVIGTKISEYCEKHHVALPKVNRLMLAGAPSPPNLIKNLSKVVENGKIIIPYGATEALPVSCTDHKEVSRLSESIISGGGSCLGRPIPNTSVLLMPIRNSPLPHEYEENILPIENALETGEICVSGDIVTDGYDQMPGATRDARFIYNSMEYHRMGDLAYWDEEHILRFLGRKAERVQTKFGTLETERCEPIINNIPGVQRSALIGIGKSPIKEPCLVVEIEDNCKMSFNSIAKKAIELMADKYPVFKIVRVFGEKSLPVDARHNAKIHRLALAAKWTLAVNKNCKLGLNQ